MNHKSRILHSFNIYYIFVISSLRVNAVESQTVLVLSLLCSRIPPSKFRTGSSPWCPRLLVFFWVLLSENTASKQNDSFLKCWNIPRHILREREGLKIVAARNCMKTQRTQARLKSGRLILNLEILVKSVCSNVHFTRAEVAKTRLLWFSNRRKSVLKVKNCGFCISNTEPGMKLSVSHCFEY